MCMYIYNLQIIQNIKILITFYIGINIRKIIPIYIITLPFEDSDRSKQI